MPPEGIAPGSPEDWLRHARSDLELARISTPPAVLPEQLCFHAQQAAEKALKAVLVAQGIHLPRTHSIRRLLDILPAEIFVPGSVQDAAGLTDYAVLTRYPGILEPIGEEDHAEAVRLAEATVSWAETVLRPQ